MSHAAVRFAPILIGAVLLMAACSPACATSGAQRAGDAGAVAAAPDAPDGFVPMEVMGVLPTSEGHAVFLVSEPEQVVLPIWIGGSEALAIQLRLERRRFERPLTHDLLDNLVRELGGHVVKVHVDDLRGATFVGTVYVSSKDQVTKIDARPSDAIALAVGNHVPIYVARQVVTKAGLTKEDMEREGVGQPPVFSEPQSQAPLTEDPYAEEIPDPGTPKRELSEPDFDELVLDPPTTVEL